MVELAEQRGDAGAATRLERQAARVEERLQPLRQVTLDPVLFGMAR